MDGPTGYVAASAVRSEVLAAVAADPPTETPDVFEYASASQSAVYEALAALEERGHITEREAGWRPTGTGSVVTDVLSLCEGANCALADTEEYWRTHRTAPFPERFRHRLGALTDAEVMRAPDTDPGRTVRAVADFIREADDLDVFAPVYHRSYGDALAEAGANARLLISPSVLAEVDDAKRRSAGETPFDVRVAPVETGLAVGDEGLYLSAPTLSGGYDDRTELVADAEEAIEWGRDLFEAHWEEADPPERFTPS